MTALTPTPVTVHVLDWQPALAGLPGVAAGIARDQAIENWAQQCWQDLCIALPGQQHAVLATPGNVEEPARLYLASPQVQGWLHSPLAEPPRWRAEMGTVASDAAALATERGFCALAPLSR